MGEWDEYELIVQNEKAEQGQYHQRPEIFVREKAHFTDVRLIKEESKCESGKAGNMDMHSSIRWLKLLLTMNSRQVFYFLCTLQHDIKIVYLISCFTTNEITHILKICFWIFIQAYFSLWRWWSDMGHIGFSLSKVGIQMRVRTVD